MLLCKRKHTIQGISKQLSSKLRITFVRSKTSCVKQCHRPSCDIMRSTCIVSESLSLLWSPKSPREHSLNSATKAEQLSTSLWLLMIIWRHQSAVWEFVQFILHTYVLYMPQKHAKRWHAFPLTRSLRERNFATRALPAATAAATAYSGHCLNVQCPLHGWINMNAYNGHPERWWTAMKRTTKRQWWRRFRKLGMCSRENQRTDYTSIYICNTIILCYGGVSSRSARVAKSRNRSFIQKDESAPVDSEKDYRTASVTPLVGDSVRRDYTETAGLLVTYERHSKVLRFNNQW